MLKVLLLRQISRATKAHHLVFLVLALFWCSAKETYPQDAHQQLQAGYPSPEVFGKRRLAGVAFAARWI